MPIITPAYPADNSAFNVSPSSLALMQRAIKEARYAVSHVCRVCTWGM